MIHQNGRGGQPNHHVQQFDMSYTICLRNSFIQYHLPICYEKHVRIIVAHFEQYARCTDNVE